jgi:YHS domain-containing protein
MRALLILVMVGFLAGMPATAQPQSKYYQVDSIALRGYDPVSYFSGSPRLGVDSIEHRHEGVIWRFATTANRDRFRAVPAAYLPQYGGYCALGMAHGGAVPADPLAYTVYQGKLYLNASTLIRITWGYARDWMIGRADPNWQSWLARLSAPAVAATQPPGPRPPTDSTLALRGFDVTSYFDDGGPRLGDSSVVASWKGKSWRFASDASRQLFLRTPERFAPEFDGLSPLILAHGESVPGDPRVFTILDGRLYLEVAEGPRETWRRNAKRLLARAREQWAEIRDRQ